MDGKALEQGTMNFFAEALFSILFNYPGAVLRWIIFRKGNLQKYVQDDYSYNMLAFSFFVGLVVVAGRFLFC